MCGLLRLKEYVPLDDFYKKIIALQEFDIVQETMDIINENSYYITGLLRLQLQKGKDGKGENVTVFGRDYYSDATIQDKRYNGTGLGKEAEYITNFMSGVFYNSLRVITEGETFAIDSDVSYFSDIIRRSGTIIMELDENSLREFSEEILIPNLQSRFSAKFNS